MASSGSTNGNGIIDGGSGNDSYTDYKQNGTTRFRFGYQNSSSKGKLSFGSAFGTNDTILFDANGGNYKGYATNTAPAAGFIGETISSFVGFGSAVSLSNGTAANVTSISLTAGIWNVCLVANFSGAPTGGQALAASISTTSATQTNDFGNSEANTPSMPTGNSSLTLCVAGYRVSLNSTTTHYFVATGVFSGGTLSAYGRITATRVA